jgi:NADPH:quinone reductase-like Zn-dependent oxidoreductase
MASTYRAVMLRGKGGLEQLTEETLPLTEPKAGELRISVRAVGAGFTDVIMRTGYYPYRPDFPFVPGYDVIGSVDAIGPGVAGFTQGQRVCALTVYGGYAEYLVRGADEFVPVPDGLDDAEVVALILNYVTAYQMIHRVAKVTPGQSVLVNGANGGVGAAALELLKVHGAKAIAAAGPKHFDFVRSLGAVPIESRGRPLDELVRAIEPNGVDAALDGLGGKITGECARATKKGGHLVCYGLTGARSSLLSTVQGFTSLYVGAPLIGRRSSFYGITQIYRKDKTPFKTDIVKLFELLAKRAIEPRIAARLPLLACRDAQRMLEEGGVVGKIVHVRE